jgi:transposase InsO family protein
MRSVRGRNGGSGQRWATFLKNHAERMWVCDFIQTHDLLFRQVYAFFLVHLASRRVVHIAATRHPTQAWTAQQLRNATMDRDAPAVLLRDRDDKFGPAFDRAARGVGAKVIRTAVRAPNMNSVAERFVGSARRELLDHVLLVDEQHLSSLLCQYARYFQRKSAASRARPTHPSGSCDGHRPVQADRGQERARRASRRLPQGGVTYDDPAGRDR